MNPNEMRKENIAVTQKIVFISYRQELYEKFYFCLAGQLDILYHRIRENNRDWFPKDRNAVLYIIEMLRFTEKSVELVYNIKKRHGVPILFISGAQTERTRKEEALRAVERGTDRYLASNLSVEEIIAEVKALIRLHVRIQKQPEAWKYQELRLVPDRRQVFLRKQEILLTRIEFDIICYLAVQNGRAVTYKELYEAVWHSEYLSDDASIMAHIHRIRLKLEKDKRNPFYIQNVYGVGYRFGCCCTGREVLKRVTDSGTPSSLATSYGFDMV